MNKVLRLVGIIVLAVAGLVPGLAHRASAADAGAASWPQFHGNEAHTGDNPAETVIGPGNVATLHQLWLARTSETNPNGDVTVANGNVYAPYTFGSDHTVRAWQASTGKVRWSVKTPVPVSAVTISAGRAFAAADYGTADNELYAFSARTGAKLWSQTLPTGGSGVQPVVAGNVVYEAGYFSMDAFDVATGAMLWQASLPGAVRSVAAVAAGRVFVTTVPEGSVRQDLTVLSAATGGVLWRRKVGPVRFASPVVSGPVVYVCSYTGLHAFGVVHGSIRWSQPDGCDQDTTPALAQGVLYTDPFYGQADVFAISATTGAVLWETASIGGEDDAPIVANGVLYVPLDSGALAAFDTATHAQLWTSPQNAFDASSPAVVNGVLYEGGSGGVYAYVPSSTAAAALVRVIKASRHRSMVATRP